MGTRFPDSVMAKIDAWAARQDDAPGRSAAIRRLVEIALTAERPSNAARSPANKARAAKLAARTIEKMIDPAAPADERAQRRRRLTKGPLEFRENRVDLPKAKK
jgi:hypothetical protein